MTKQERRQKIINTICESKSPVSGKELAESCHVSRQVIVQDIALIRETGYDILSTNRGYIINAPHVVTRIFKVSHSDEQMEDELLSIVDLGGTVVNVMVNHRVYGHLEARLGINSRKKVMDFIEDIKLGKSSPLKNITSNYHYHTVEAEDQETLDGIEKMLREKSYLIERIQTPITEEVG
ncbi:MAG: transcription repressor NadR [Hespellia sp.]|jgi:transcriptional regulator of NAD metabolism|nr:transcription repressor NadR [Hespellia sp.]